MVGSIEEEFVVTAWKDKEELFQLRTWLHSPDVEARRRGVELVQAWKLRKSELPLLLESTADLVDAQVQDERGILGGSSLKLLYGGAIARFITGFADTTLELRRSKPAFQSQISTPTTSTQKAPSQPQYPLSLPSHLLETRHSIVHREYPSLPTLKRTCRECLDWLWEWYWSRLDVAFAYRPEASVDLDAAEIRTSIQGILKNYLKARKSEIKVKRKSPGSAAAQNAVDSVEAMISTPSTSKTVYDILLHQLVDEAAIIPTGRAMGTSMSGAFLLWSPILSLLSSRMEFFSALLLRLRSLISDPASSSVVAEENPISEALSDWLVHILVSNEWESVRASAKKAEIRDGRQFGIEGVLEELLMDPGYWALNVAKRVIDVGGVRDSGPWRQILEAAKGNGKEGSEMDVDEEAVGDRIEQDREGVEEAKGSNSVIQKTEGPQKWIGLWTPKPIGVLPAGWEDDE